MEKRVTLGGEPGQDNKPTKTRRFVSGAVVGKSEPERALLPARVCKCIRVFCLIRWSRDKKVAKIEFVNSIPACQCCLRAAGDSPKSYVIRGLRGLLIETGVYSRVPTRTFSVPGFFFLAPPTR